MSDDWYGRWAARTPQDAAEAFAGYPGRWWVAGGWCLEAFTGVRRDHGDIDLEALRQDLPLLRRHFAGRFHTWAVGSGMLLALYPDDRPEAPADEVLFEGCGQFWLRPDPYLPWEYDVQFNLGNDEHWAYKRDPSLTLPWSQVLWQRDGIHYLQPEIQLLYKAKGLRDKDEADFAATLPHLDDARRGWLAGALDRTLPGHPWRDRLS